MAGIARFFQWKHALLWQTIFFSLALLQEEFYFGQLWFIMNCFVMFALLRATYADSSSNRLVAWYLYCVTIFTDTLSLIVFGSEGDRFAGIFGFCLAMAIILLIPKPVFIFFLYKSLKDEGVDIRRGIRTGTGALADQTYKGVDTGYVNQGTNAADNNNAMASNNATYGFPDQSPQQQSSQQQQPPPSDVNDFMSDIPPATQSTNDGAQASAPGNEYGDFVQPGNNV